VIVDRAELPADVVSMSSRVTFVDECSGQRREVTLVYPARAHPAAGRLSVLAPLGAALLGLSVGQTIEWPLPGGRTARVRIEAVHYQPEAAGDLDG
jgi:regulator of nucleoside diphosphate kinase